MKTFAPLFPVLLLVGCGSGAADEEAKPDPVALVRTAPATLGATTGSVVVYGAAEAGPSGEHSVTVPAEALVDRIDAPNGTAVRQGQAILTLRPSRTTATDIAKASSDAAAADAAYQRALRLRRDGLVSDADVETARAAAATAQATRANLGMDGGGTVLRAPFGGTVQALTAKPGDQMAAGATIAIIAGTGDLRARFGVDPALAQRVRPGQSIAVDSVSGTIHAIVPVVGIDTQVDPTTRLASVFAKLPRPLGFGPGEPVRGSLSVGASANGMTIPYAALLDDGGRSYVFVVHGDTAKAQDVSPGNALGDRIQILKGLNPGDIVVTEGGTGLDDGMKVRVDQARGSK